MGETPRAGEAAPGNSDTGGTAAMDTITTRELKERLESLQGQEVTLLG